MKLFKPVGAVVGAISLIALTSCSGASPDAATGDEDVTIKVAWTASFGDAGQAIADAFTKENPNVTIEFSSAVSADYRTLLITQLSSGTAPDVFWVDSGSSDPETQGQLAPFDYLEDLSDQPWVADLPEQYKSPLTQTDGKTYYLPMASSALGTIYNMDLMKEVGLEVPTTFRQLLDNCEEARGLGYDYFSWTMGSSAGNNLVWQMVASAGLLDGDEDWFDRRLAGEVTFADSPEWNLVYDEIVKMIDAGCMQPNGAAVATAYEDTFRALANKDALSTPVGTPPMVRIRDAAPGVNFEIHPFPVTDDPADMRVSTYPSGGPALNAASSGAAREAGLAFIAFAASEEGRSLSASNDASIPKFLGDGDGSDAQAGNAVVTKLIDEGLGRPAFSGRLAGPSLAQYMIETNQALATGATTPDEILAGFDVAWDAEVANR